MEPSSLHHTDRAGMSLKQLNEAWAQRSVLWYRNEERAALIDAIWTEALKCSITEDGVLKSLTVDIDSAVCLGLGSLEYTYFSL